MSAALGIQLTAASAIDRSQTDFYPTPPEATHALMRYLQLPSDTKVWEPACGQGHMAEVIGQYCSVTSSDKYDDSYALPLQDFLRPDRVPEFDWIITNPPFKFSEEFIAQAEKHGKPFALLLKSQYWHAKRRLSVFKRTKPAAILPLTWRPDFHMGTKGGAPTMEVAWTVWIPGSTQTHYEPLERPAGVK